MKVSVIVPTYNGEKKLPTALRALSKQTFSKFELIIVVDGSIDGTKRVISNFEKSFEDLKVIFQQNKGRASVRNRGALEAKGDLLIFYDDDMEPSADSVERHVQFHKNHEGILTGNQCEFEDETKTDIQNYKARLNTIWMSKYKGGLNMLFANNLFFTAANCSVRKDVFFSLNGFDETLTDGEDYEFAYRAIHRGVKVFFDKSNEAIHHDYISCRSYVRRLREYSQAHQKLPEFNFTREGNDSQGKILFKEIVYWFFASPLWPRLIDSINLFMVFPKRIRYKIYDVILHSLSKIYPHIPIH